MFHSYYRLPLLLAASVSLPLAGCGGTPPRTAATLPPAQQTAQNTQSGVDTDATIWTVLGLNKEHRVSPKGPIIGADVSPILWQAAHDTLGFVKITSEDPMTGRIASDWYSPPDKPNERLKVGVYIMARALRSDALAVRVKRQVRSEAGEWQDASVDRKVDDDLTFAILHRAQQIRHFLAEKIE